METNRIVIVERFKGTNPDALSNIADAITNKLDEGFVLAAQTLAYYTSPSTGEPTAVTLLTFVK
jgi:hypothetical protein